MQDPCQAYKKNKKDLIFQYFKGFITFEHKITQCHLHA